MAPAAHTRGTRITMGSAVGAIRWGLDRMLSVAYGVVYDYVYERFTPYQRLQTEVRQLVEAGSPSCGDRRDVRGVGGACGPGNFTCALAAAGFTLTRLDSSRAPVEGAKEKRPARHPSHLRVPHRGL